LQFQDRFVRLAQTSRIPTKRSDSKYSRAIRQRHAAVLGICALIESYPYTIERWMPQLLTETLAEMAYDPVRKTLFQFLHTSFTTCPDPY
jgi:proteasome activator subunit 4